MFATHGLLTTLVSDNGPPFTSAEFEKFMKANGIIHRHIPPYHPSSNGLAENMVRTVKQALSKYKISANATLETHIARFFASYHNTRHTTTSRAPAELLLCQTPQTRLSLIHPCASQRMEETVENQVGSHQPRHFSVDSNVLVRDLQPTATDKWRQGIVTKVLGPLTYEVCISGHTRQPHIDHLLPCPTTTTDATNSNSDCSLSPQLPPKSDVMDNKHPSQTHNSPKCLIEELD